jgi:NTE family protein
MPFKFKEEVLFDGGVTYPLPTEPLVQMGIKKIIAVNVTPSRDDILKQLKKFKESPSGSNAGNQKPKPLSLFRRFKNIFKLNILEIIFSSVEVLQSEVARKESELADVVLHPDTTGLFWMEFHKADEFAKRGEDEARKNLDKIRQLINE